jgi:hypothetical protein
MATTSYGRLWFFSRSLPAMAPAECGKLVAAQHGAWRQSPAAAPTVSLSARRRPLAVKSAAPDHKAHLSVAGRDVDRGDHPDHAPLWRCRPIGQPRTVAQGCRCDKPWRSVCHLCGWSRRPRRRCFPPIPCRTIRTKAHLVRRRAGGNIGPSLHTSLHPRRNDRRGCFCVCRDEGRHRHRSSLNVPGN